MQSKLPVIFSLFFKKAHKDERKKSIKKRDQTECITYSQRSLKVTQLSRGDLHSPEIT